MRALLTLHDLLISETIYHHSHLLKKNPKADEKNNKIDYIYFYQIQLGKIVKQMNELFILLYLYI